MRWRAATCLGLILLISVAMAVSQYRLARRQHDPAYVWGQYYESRYALISSSLGSPDRAAQERHATTTQWSTWSWRRNLINDRNAGTSIPTTPDPKPHEGVGR